MLNNNNNNNSNYYCRICGLYADIPIWSSKTHGSHEICSCCGCEFGYDDCSYEAVQGYREDWLKKGTNWFSPELKPQDWNLEQQLKQIPEQYQ